MDENKMNINWYPGHMAKAKREIIEDLKLIDVVIEILDARIPVSSQNPDIKDIINKKKRIIILNKYDLANEYDTRKWQKYFNDQGIETVLVNSNSGEGIRETINKIEKIMQKERNESAKKGRINKTIRVLVLGIPNVRKILFYK